MRLTTLSDYALRVLMYCRSLRRQAPHHRRDCAHLSDFAGALDEGCQYIGTKRLLEGVRGRSGGFMLAKAPEAIVVGDVVRATEPDFALVECFGTGNQCIVTGCCKLPTMLNEALNSFIATLDRYTIADLMLKRSDFYTPNTSPYIWCARTHN